MSASDPLASALAVLERCLAALQTWQDVERRTGKPALRLIAEHRGNYRLLRRGTITDPEWRESARARLRSEWHDVRLARAARRVLEADGLAAGDLAEALALDSRPVRDLVRGRGEALAAAIRVVDDARAKLRGVMQARQLAAPPAPRPAAEAEAVVETPAKEKETGATVAPVITFGVGTITVGVTTADVPESDWLKILQGVAPDGRIGERVLLEDLARRVYTSKELQGLDDWKRALKARIDRLNEYLRSSTKTKLSVKTNLKAGWACLLWLETRRARS